MLIETKFDLDQEIYYSSNEKVKKGVVIDYYVRYDTYFVQPEEGGPLTLPASALKAFEDVRNTIRADLEGQIVTLQSKVAELRAVPVKEMIIEV